MMKHSTILYIFFLTPLFLCNNYLQSMQKTPKNSEAIETNRYNLGQGLMSFDLKLMRQALNDPAGIGDINSTFMIHSGLMFERNKKELQGNEESVAYMGHILDHYFYIVQQNLMYPDLYEHSNQLSKTNAIPILSTLLSHKNINSNITLRLASENNDGCTPLALIHNLKEKLMHNEDAIQLCQWIETILSSHNHNKK